MEEDKILKAEEAISKNEKIYNYRSTQWQLDHIANIFNDEVLDDDNNKELTVPTYQRKYVWSEQAKYDFIESLLLNIPIPFIFINEDQKTAEMTVIDWYQRVRTIKDFLNNEFCLNKLEKLPELNGLFFKNLTEVRQRLFKRKLINVIIFEWLTIEQQKETFKRINSTSNLLNDSEKRKWAMSEDLYNLIKELSSYSLFKELCPIRESKLNREEDLELILRYFAYTESFDEYNWNVRLFLNNYLEKKDWEIEKDKNILENMKENFFEMLDFVKNNFDNWFKKRKSDKVINSRVYFEAISVWVWLALKESKKLNIQIIKKLLKNKTFAEIISSDWANAKSKFQARINSVKNALLHSKLPWDE